MPPKAPKAATKMCDNGTVCDNKATCAYSHTRIPKPCKNQVCTRLGCLFMHEGQKMPACQFWAVKGTCARINTCPYAHPPRAEPIATQPKPVSDVAAVQIESALSPPDEEEAPPVPAPVPAHHHQHDTHAGDDLATVTELHRAAMPCDEGQMCKMYSCPFTHPIGRRRMCKFADQCIRKKCKFLHPIDTDLQVLRNKYRCAICSDMSQITYGVLCGNKHFICSKCFEGHANSILTGDDRLLLGGVIKCPEIVPRACSYEFAEDVIRANISPITLRAYETIKQEKIEAKTRSAFEQQAKRERADLLKLDATERDLVLHI